MSIHLFKKDFIYLLLERREGRKKEGEKHQCVLASHIPPTEDLAHNPGMCPDWESNWRPFGSQASVQSTEPHQPGLKINKILKKNKMGMIITTSFLKLSGFSEL